MTKEEFAKLFEAYLQNTISDPELQQFMDVVKSDDYNDFIKETIFNSLQDNNVTETIDQQQGQYILDQILSKPAHTPRVVQLPLQKRKRRIATRFVLVAASVLILFAIGNIFFYKNPSAVPITAPDQNTVIENPILAFSGKQLIHLPDGSTILLNKNSSIEYNQNNFNDKTREVTLVGEAYFDIKRNEKKAFIVHTGKVSTKVLGTAFNINAYGLSDHIEVTVERGKVQVGDAKKIYGIITPNQQIKVNKSTLNFEQNNVKIETAIAWKSNYLILDNLNMEEAAALISQKYKVPILLSNEQIKNCRITASFLNEEDLDHVLKVVCSVIETNYHYNKNNAIVLEGKGCE